MPKAFAYLPNYMEKLPLLKAPKLFTYIIFNLDYKKFH